LNDYSIGPVCLHRLKSRLEFRDVMDQLVACEESRTL